MNDIKFRQIAFIYLIGVSSFAAFLLPDAVSVYAGKASVWIPLLSLALSFLLAYILHRNMKQYGSLRAAVRSRFGEKGVKVFAFILLLWFGLIACFYVCAFYQRLASTTFGYVPRLVCIISVVLCAGLFAFSPFKTVARSGSVVFIIMLLSLFLLILFSASGVEVTSLLPVKAKSFTLFLRAFLLPLGNTGLLCLLLFFYEGQTPKLSALNLTLFGAAGVLSLFLFLIHTVFGTAFAEQLSFPFFALIKSTDSLIKLEHFESFMSGVWIVMSLCFLLALFCMMLTAWQKVTCFRAPKWALPARLIPYGAVLLAAILVPNNRFLCAFILGTAVPLGNIILGILPVCALSILKPSANKF